MIVIIVLLVIVFLVDPESISAIEGSTVEFTCTANNTDIIDYRVNGSSAGSNTIAIKGFNQIGFEELSPMVTRRNLSVAVSSLYNNTEILCRAIGTAIVDSNTAILTVQGIILIVNVLYMLLLLSLLWQIHYHQLLVYHNYSFINSSTVNITWSPPFTLPGTNIIGYNISVATSNDSITINYFTSNSYHVLLLTDSSCNDIIITVSGYNGLDGENNTISYLPTG